MHLENLREKYQEEIDEILRSLYVNNIIAGGTNTNEVQNLKDIVTSVFGEATFRLHNWNSNEPQLETQNIALGDEQQTLAKQQLGVQEEEPKLLGLLWNKEADTTAVTFPGEPADITKRTILRFLASVYVSLTCMSPTMLVGKLLYHQACDNHSPWDKVSDRIGQLWFQFMRDLPSKVEGLRGLPMFKEQINQVDLHAFGEPSKSGLSAAV